ncbi:hypothetical protein GALMADRAFT_1162741 [Galerina marginata CBS 339.88]|uniref:Uncharacterized protein n=1 Tax=Galerina marginata (strain CBS 339.88) TaxID=685588 RepID=A0A067SHR1_GALM3|nr:hypothetical protein GALMADRAFT_1162741 [Galerina marginata CBS 339.88]
MKFWQHGSREPSTFRRNAGRDARFLNLCLSRFGLYFGPLSFRAHLFFFHKYFTGVVLHLPSGCPHLPYDDCLLPGNTSISAAGGVLARRRLPDYHGTSCLCWLSSQGGVESLVGSPARMTNGTILPTEWACLGSKIHFSGMV